MARVAWAAVFPKPQDNRVGRLLAKCFTRRNGKRTGAEGSNEGRQHATEECGAGPTEAFNNQRTRGRLEGRRKREGKEDDAALSNRRWGTRKGRRTYTE
jgi:hypothetical protein